MAGVAALFTREFFQPRATGWRRGGMFCQWAHTYDISDADLRSIVATFRLGVSGRARCGSSATADLLLIGSRTDAAIDLSPLQGETKLPRMAADLAEVFAHDPFARFSMFVGGAETLRSYSAAADIQTDDRMSLEFSAPAAMYGTTGSENAAALRALRGREPLPGPAARAIASAGAPQWRNRGLMMKGAGAHDEAYDDFAHAITIDPTDAASLAGLVETAVATQQEAAAQLVLEHTGSTTVSSPLPWIALSRLFAAAGRMDDALTAVVRAGRVAPDAPESLEQLASVYADAGDAAMLQVAAERLLRVFPDRPSGPYYAAAAEFMRDRLEPALALARDATRLDAGYADAHNLQGAILARLGDTGGARQAFETALRLNPRDSSAYRNLGLLELSSGNTAAAARFFAEALALDPSSEANRQSLADALVTGHR